MVVTSIEGITIAGVAAAVSNKWTAIKDLPGVDEKLAKDFQKNTGVQGRYDAGLHQTSSDFCFAAARELIEKKGINKDEIGVLVYVTQTADYRIPATACILQERLGLSKDCIAFDVNLGCSGFTYGLNIVSSLLKTSNATKGLLLAGDTSVKERSPIHKARTSHSASMLFGDCGTATLLEKDDNAEPMHMISRTDGKGYKAIIAPYGWWRNPDPPSVEKFGASTMDDVAVFNFAISEAPQLIKETMELTGATAEDYDGLALHQANLFILKQVTKRAGFPKDKMMVSMDLFGNTSSASIPVSLVKEYGEKADDAATEESVGGKRRIMSCGFGVGLSWSTVDFYVNPDDVLPLVHTDEYFADGIWKEDTESDGKQD